jgi:hypothetical protein
MQRQSMRLPKVPARECGDVLGFVESKKADIVEA